MRIAVVVQGRFHAFDLVKAMLKRGHDIHVFTNYPKWVTRRFGLSDEKIHSFWQHGIAARFAERMGLEKLLDPILHRSFGHWAKKGIAGERWDVIHAFSGVAEEPLRSKRGAVHLMVRGSSHIRGQY